MTWIRAGGGDCGGGGTAAAVRLLAGFRAGLYRCLTRRADALFGVADAVLCAGGRVTDLARLSLVPEFGRGHGALYDGLNAGRVEVARLRWAVGCLPLPAWPDGRIRLAVDVCSWLRPDARTSPGRMFCHVRGRGKNAGQVIRGWPYSFVAALGPGASSWALLLDAVRIGPDDDETALAAGQVREVVGRLAAAGAWRDGDPDIIIVLDAGYHVTRLAWLLADLPVALAARLRPDRVFYAAAPPKAPSAAGRQPRHGTAVSCADAATWGGAAVTQAADTPGYGPVQVRAWHRMHQKLTRQPGSGWEDYPRDAELPLIPGTLIQLTATRPRPGYPALTPMWLWASVPDADDAEVRALWQAYHRRFDIERSKPRCCHMHGWLALPSVPSRSVFVLAA